ncbi:MAG: TonB-dependent receptor [Thermodesulfovibrionales bacterium]|nr:TonB-dependent receptor [Thermodesulfovibrionales bacterium]
MKASLQFLKLIICILLLFIFHFSFIASLFAEEEIKIEEIVVTATRIEEPVKEVASSVTVITEKEIESKKAKTILEVLKDVPGVDISQSGGFGQLTDIFIRGAKPEHTLIMIDGVEMNDPMSPGRSYDIAHLSVDNIERVEIVRGPQSTLYGSDAISGVINIITKKGEGKPKFSISGGGGSYNTFRETAGLSGGTKWVNYSLGISRLDTKGFSAAHERYGNTEKDGYKNTSLSARVGFTPTEYLNIDFIVRHINAETDLDTKGGRGGDDPNYVSDSKQLFLRTQGSLLLFNGLWEQKLGFSLSNHDRDYRDDKDAQHPHDSSRGFYNGKMRKVDWQHNLYLHKTNTLTIGVEYEEERGESEYSWESAWGPGKSVFPEKSANTKGAYIQDKIALYESFFVTLGIRVDDHSRFGSETLYRIAPAYLFKKTGTKIKATYGTGFKAPSLYQLYAPATAWGPIGNENLKPERSKGWDVGMEQYLFQGRLTLGATYFRNDFEDLIDFDWAKGYINIAEAKTEGAEIFASVRPIIKDLSVRLGYTYTDTEDKKTGQRLLRKPMNKGSLNLNYLFLKKGSVNVDIIYVGRRDDLNPDTYERAKAGDYTLVNLAASYDISKNIQVFGRVENLLDRDYEEVSGYGTPRFTLFGGIKITL